MSETIITLEQCLAVNENIRTKLQHATSYLLQCGVEEAKENAQLILLHVLSVERVNLLLMWQDIFPAEKLAQWGELLSRKGKGEPIQYMIGEAWFYGRKFSVSSAVLIPRPETELLVEAVLKEGMNLWQEKAKQPVVLDVGAGSGAISLTIQLEQPNWRVVASDISADALTVAKHNATSFGIVDKMGWQQGDLLQPFIEGQALQYEGEHIDILVSNPPYIPERDMAQLQREVRDFEPHLALVGGEDGLDPYRLMILKLAELEVKPTIVAFELGIHQPAIVVEMIKAIGAWNDISIITDYNGIDRHVIAIKK
ncbi:MAG: peptide chain release factor N(5)-glutamine methyltransferase [Candidatus Pristimantibacillus lignocellulolyticus]|uniref:Release factor glutamine methyltransferase n=1 Tax=Candidatus Pristimantibacillus lignocellulolyticus TaxID=2994561 RepID=A0A9J6ZJ17_9BACL|nr:MAG: peptide chain release factor N(5)-glutamine methyltransferase [Candidatus Pristimantibacillus lignocellulolyticus]